MTKIGIKIDNCSECPNFQSKRVYTADSFEMVFTRKCTPVNKIPKWCPIKIEE